MSENTLGIVGALWAKGEADRKAQDAQFEADRKTSALQEANNDLQELNYRATQFGGELEDEIAILHRNNHHLLVEFAKERECRNEVVRKHNSLVKKNDALLDEVDALKAELEKQRQSLADWIVSQKAFKELAIRLGAQQGLSVQEVFKQGRDLALDVLDNKNEKAHNTSIEGLPIVTVERAEKIRKRFQEETKNKPS